MSAVPPADSRPDHAAAPRPEEIAALLAKQRERAEWTATLTARDMDGISAVNITLRLLEVLDLADVLLAERRRHIQALELLWLNPDRPPAVIAETARKAIEGTGCAPLAEGTPQVGTGQGQGASAPHDPAPAEVAQLREALEAEDDLLRRISAWDMLTVATDGTGLFTADAPFWQDEITKVLALARDPSQDRETPRRAPEEISAAGWDDLARAAAAVRDPAPPPASEPWKFSGRCTGNADCVGLVHIHGCLADVDGAICDSPSQHPARPAPPQETP